MSGKDGTIQDGTGGGSGIDVRPDAVRQFGTRAGAEAKDFMGQAQDSESSLTSQAAGIGSPFQEAEYFNQQHTQGVEKLALFNNDAAIGLNSLGMGATSISSTYVNGDTTSAATMNDVEQAFDKTGVRQLPTPDRVSLPSPQLPPAQPDAGALDDIQDTENQEQTTGDSWG